MKRVIFAGTSEGRELCQALSEAGLTATVCVATEYGRAVLPQLAGITVHAGRMTAEQMTDFVRDADVVVDATHPYAVEVSKNIRRACEAAGVKRLRLLRPRTQVEGAVCVPSAQAAAEFLATVRGNVLLTVGSKELHCFAAVPDYTERLWPRVLPAARSMEICLGLGFPASHIIMMQGPFSCELNVAMLHSCGAQWLVTKDTGEAGGLPEKLEAARQCGVRVVLIQRPEEDGLTPQQVREQLIGRPPRFPLFVDMTGRRCLVVGSGKIGLRRADVLLRYGAHVTLVAPDAAQLDGVTCIRRAFVPSDVNGMFFVTAATNDRAVNREISALCAQQNIFVSTADAPEESSVFFPAVRAAGGLSAGVVSDGTDHHRTTRTARAIERILHEEDDE